MPRAQLPAHSPLTFRALLAGLAGAAGKDAHAVLSALLRSHFGASDVLLTSSGTAALTLAITAALRSARGPVALPAYACYDLATAADGAHVKVVLYDLDPETLAPEPDSFSRALAQQPDAVVLVHLYGIPLDVAALAKQAEAAGAVVIEDAAQAIGASVRGILAGSLGSVAVLSFGRGKGLTGGGGGALLASDTAGDRILVHARSSVHGKRSGWLEWVKSGAQWLLARPAWYELPTALPFLRLGETIYHPPQAARPLSSASAQMVKALWSDSLNAAETRRSNALRLQAAASSVAGWRAVRVEPGMSPGYLRLPLICAHARESVLDARARRLGVMQGYPLPLYALPGFRERCLNAGDDFRGATRLASSLVTLPTHDLLNEQDLSALESWLREPVSSKRSWPARPAADLSAMV